jgi:hypothetical protein
MAFQKIIKKLYEVGFDQFHQAGSVSFFHPLNIVADSKATNKRYWICVDGGYHCPNTFSISFRDLDNSNAPSTRIICKDQAGVVKQLNNIALEIKLLSA